VAERSDEIKDRIDAQRGELGENLHELERRVKSSTDWRAQMEKRPWVMMGAAFGTGMLIAGVISRSGRSASYSYRSSYSDTSSPEYYSSKTGESRFKNFREQRHQAAGALDRMTGALIAVGVQKLQDVLKESIPGFRDKYDHSDMSSSEQGREMQGGSSRSDQPYGDYGQSQAGQYDRAPSPAL
jgi:hypothetical protein